MKGRTDTKAKAIAAAATAPIPASQTNVLDFTSTLKELRKHLDPTLVRQREGRRDRNGNVHTVDYVEWHTVADILDESAPNWGHEIKDVRVFGELVVVTVAIVINGVSREGIGTGHSRSEMGIKKAEHDALKRAAVKFGIARDLYKKEFEAFESVQNDTREEPRERRFPSDPVAQTLADMVTTKQLGMIRAVSREAGVNADEECRSTMSCQITELSRRAASAFIDHLREIHEQHAPMRRVS